MLSTLRFLDGGIRALVDGLALFEAQASLPPEKRNMHSVARAIHSVHLASERLLKHIIADVDPYLLIAEPRAELLKTLRKAVRHQGVPSIFMSSVAFQTVKPIPLVKLIQEVVKPEIDEQLFASFLDAFRVINNLRNSAEHGELHGDTDKLLADVRRLLAELYALLSDLLPEAFDGLRYHDGQAESRMKAYKAEIDAAWTVLTDYVKAHGALELSTKMYVTLPPEGNISIAAGGTTAPNNLLLQAELARTAGDGFFALLVTEDQLGSRRLQRALGDLTLTPTEPAPPANQSSGWLLGALGLNQPPSVILPLEDGRLVIESTNGLLYLQLPKLAGRQFLSVEVSLLNWLVTVQARARRGDIKGVLVPSRRGLSAVPLAEVDGGVELEGEYVVPESETPPGGLIPGSVLRILNINFRVGLPSPPRGLVTIPPTR